MSYSEGRCVHLLRLQLTGNSKSIAFREKFAPTHAAAEARDVRGKKQKSHAGAIDAFAVNVICCLVN